MSGSGWCKGEPETLESSTRRSARGLSTRTDHSRSHKIKWQQRRDRLYRLKLLKKLPKDLRESVLSMYFPPAKKAVIGKRVVKCCRGAAGMVFDREMTAEEMNLLTSSSLREAVICEVQEEVSTGPVS